MQIEKHSMPLKSGAKRGGKFWAKKRSAFCTWQAGLKKLLHRLLLRIKGQACFLAAKGAHAIKGHGGASERVQLVAGLCKWRPTCYWDSLLALLCLGVGACQCWKTVEFPESNELYIKDIFSLFLFLILYKYTWICVPTRDGVHFKPGLIAQIINKMGWDEWAIN